MRFELRVRGHKLLFSFDPHLVQTKSPWSCCSRYYVNMQWDVSSPHSKSLLDLDMPSPEELADTLAPLTASKRTVLTEALLASDTRSNIDPRTGLRTG